MIRPTISLTTISAVASESGDVAEIRFSHTTATNAPVHIDFDVTGNGPFDLNIASNYIIIPAGQRTATLRLSAKTDTEREGQRIVTLTLRPTSAFSIDSAASSASIMVDDSDGSPPPERKLFISIDDGLFRLTYLGPSGKAVDFESSNNLETWRPFTTAESINNAAEIIFDVADLFEFFRAVER